MSNTQVFNCENCDAPNAHQSEGMYVCIECDNFKCAECGIPNDDTGLLVTFDEKYQRCVCEDCWIGKRNVCEPCWVSKKRFDIEIMFAEGKKIGVCEECGAIPEEEKKETKPIINHYRLTEINLNCCEECGAKWGNCDCNPELCEECGADDDNEMYEGRLLCCVCIECYEEQEEE